MKRVKKAFDIHHFFARMKRVFNIRCYFASVKFAQRYLKTGIYLYNGNYVGKKIRGIPLVVINKKNTRTDFKIHFGTWNEKIVFIFDDIIVSLYTKRRANKWFDKIKNYQNDLCYNSSKYLCFNKRGKYLVCERIIENDPVDFMHLARYIIEANKNTKWVKEERKDELTNKFHLDNVFSYIQHGDADKRNFFYNEKNKEFCAIDLDTINYYPALFDLLRLLLFDYEHEGLKIFLGDTLDYELNELFTCHNCVLDKDLYLAAFIALSYKRV